MSLMSLLFLINFAFFYPTSTFNLNLKFKVLTQFSAFYYISNISRFPFFPFFNSLQSHKTFNCTRNMNKKEFKNVPQQLYLNQKKVLSVVRRKLSIKCGKYYFNCYLPPSLLISNTTQAAAKKYILRNK
jgi:hypothetical protein